MLNMEHDERNNILRILESAIICVKEGNINKLKELSDQTIHDASTYQDQYCTSIAVIMYSLFKIFSRIDYKQKAGWQEYENGILSLLESMKNNLKLKNYSSFDRSIKRFFLIINKIEGKLKLYVQDVINNAKISKGSRLYEHGISLARTAELFGVSAYELMSYVGKTGIADVYTPKKNMLVKRLTMARGLFNE